MIRHEAEEEKEADKTPTAQTPDEQDEVGEDDEAFERRFQETEKALQERLEQLSLKLKEHEIEDQVTPQPGVAVDDTTATKDTKVPAATVSEA